ncbi:PH domain-containing protein [Maledivibacter halophilus]|uniref:PH domain-containing protein n=1 Tax=Maledivibacter halophilus TaxID=36842 RepID=A0A1T5M1L4_9FIRM|nr:PH domain-containing protein [Maledivibacter halophilus]SKC82116.1 PH domain-containing protein [Maledivibacter halophilus]
MEFHSKKDLWLGLLIWIPIGGGFIASLMGEGLFIKILMLAILIFIGWMWFGTRYYISNGIIIVKYGPFRKSIVIKDIKTIKKTNNPISSPALSIDRIEIRYGYSGIVLISPRDMEGFIKLILKENGNIEINI